MKWLIGLLAIIITGCKNNIDEEYDIIENMKFSGYDIYYKSDGYCDQEVYERIYEDKVNIYYIPTSGCNINGEYHFIKYRSEYVTVKRAIDIKIISIADLLESDLKFIVEKK